MVDLLVVEGKADVDALSGRGLTALAMCARQKGGIPMIRHLFSLGANPDANGRWVAGCPSQPLSVLTVPWPCDRQRVPALLFMSATVATPIPSGWTPLAFAAAAGRADVVEALAALGADVEARNELGVPPLLLAASAGHLPAVQALVLHGARCAAAEHDGYSLWNHYGRGQPAVLAWCRFFGPLSPLHVAAALRRPRRVLDLLAAGHSPSSPLRPSVREVAAGRAFPGAAPVDAPTLRLVERALQPYSPRDSHGTAHPQFRRAVCTLLLVRQRLERQHGAGASLELPAELWRKVFGFLYAATRDDQRCGRLRPEALAVPSSRA